MAKDKSKKVKKPYKKPEMTISEKLKLGRKKITRVGSGLEKK